ncbi:RidA family protein [Actinophytocola sp.]|uniref:RidA family protein n=1 Tax=Actinophytocola sp. TaxID=1872138 RepID=UPI003899DAA2
MTWERVPAGSVWGPVVGYCRAVRCGQMIVVAGTTAACEDGGPVGGTDIGLQTREALTRIVRALKELGADVEHVVRTRMFVTDISRWEEVGRVHGEFFGGVLPAATMVEVSSLIEPELMIEIEADAVLP